VPPPPKPTPTPTPTPIPEPTPIPTPKPIPTIEPDPTPEDVEEFIKEYSEATISWPPHVVIGDYETPLWFPTMPGQAGDCFD